jgi:competence protein ComEA
MTSTEFDPSARFGAPRPRTEVASPEDEGGGLAIAPAARPHTELGERAARDAGSTPLSRIRAAWRANVWAPVALKLAGLGLGMLALAGIGAVSILAGLNGVDVPLGRMLRSDIRGGWLADKPVASARADAKQPNPPNAHTPAETTASPIRSPSTHAPEVTPVADLTQPSLKTAANASSSADADNDSHTHADTGKDSKPTSVTGITPDGKVILNLATEDELTRLPGVGKKRAAAIVALRTKLGHFKRATDLLRVKGIGVRGLKRLLPHALVDAPPADAAATAPTLSG